MKNWYVLIDELTHEQECELVRLMFGVKGRMLHASDCCSYLGCHGGQANQLDYWASECTFCNGEKLSYKQAVELLDGELSDGS